jgi:hypothetical protein
MKTSPAPILTLDRETTIHGLFKHDNVTFSIPPYQRAYAWETEKDRKQVVQFLEDLKEHPQNSREQKRYFLGHFLFEREQPNANEFLVIDGQQRLTTVVLFFNCLTRELASRQQAGDPLLRRDETMVDLQALRQTFVMAAHGGRKLKTVDYDDSLFRSLLLQTPVTEKPNTRSGERLQEAVELMTRWMKEERSTPELIRWMELLESAVVTTFEVNSKEQATQIFAFQNDRGKDLTKLEKLKAFLMHTVYVHSPAEIERESIDDVESKFADIYRLAEEIVTMKEDQVLAHHLTAFIGWTDNPVDLLKKTLAKNGTGPERVEWIRTSFCAKLVQSFRNVTVIERLMKGSLVHERLIADVLHLHPWASWPLLLKLMAFHSHELPRLVEALRLVEITLFKLEFMKGKSTNSLPDIARRYKGDDLGALTRELEYISQQGFKDYWDFNGEIRRFLEGSYHYDKRTRYLLWKFENALRSEERGEHPLLLQEYLNETEGQNLDGSLEHIMPKDPETLVHTEEFKRDFLHNLGNLVLMTKGRNSSLKNKLPPEKAMELRRTSYLTQQAVVETINAEGWGEAQIAARKQVIVDFAMRHWRIGTVAQ